MRDGAPRAGRNGYIGGRGHSGSTQNAHGSSGHECARLERFHMPKTGYIFRIFAIRGVNLETCCCEYVYGVRIWTRGRALQHQGSVWCDSYHVVRPYRPPITTPSGAFTAALGAEGGPGDGNHVILLV